MINTVDFSRLKWRSCGGDLFMKRLKWNVCKDLCDARGCVSDMSY